MVDTWSVTDNDWRTVVSFSFCNSLDTLIIVSTHSNVSNVNVAVAHCDTCKILLLNFLTCCCKLCNSACRSWLWRLTACIWVNFCIEYEDIYVFTGSDNVVKTAETDIVSPTVAAEDPLWFLSQIILRSKDLLSCVATACFQSSNQLFCSRCVSVAVINSVKIFSNCCLNVSIVCSFI